jgi:hypothetical protein
MREILKGKAYNPTSLKVKVEPPCAPKKRGRPKGAKNKPKNIELPQQTAKVKEAKRGRGRPKGSKNKPKSEENKILVKSKPRRSQETQEARPSKSEEKSSRQDSIQEHPLYLAVNWLCSYMHNTQAQYYRARATRNGTSVHEAMLADVLGFFNVQNADILKLIKKNNFIAT